jgi:alpha-glucoside transport system substrate-binding protein
VTPVRALPALLLSAALLLVAGCAGPPPIRYDGQGPDLRGDTIEIAGLWSGSEQQDFQQVIDEFERQTGASVHYTSDGDNLPTVLQSRVAGENAPNIAFLAQPGSISQFAEEGALKPLAPDVEAAVDQHELPAWKRFGIVRGIPYAVWFDASDKSVVWYNAGTFAAAGVHPPQTWPQFIRLAGDLADQGVTPMSIGAADGWVLTDWFEQVYLQTAGLARYNELAAHEIPWTDPSVATALGVLAQLFGQPRDLAGGSSGALQTDFPTSVVNTFSEQPKAAMVYEGDFVATAIQQSTRAQVGTDARTFPFPRIGAAKPGVESGGDAAVAFTDDPATTAFMKFLAGPQAGAIFVRSGGFLSPDKDIPASVYPNDIVRGEEQQLVDAGDNVVFDASDQAPPSFGASKGSGEWKDLEDFLADPADIRGAMSVLESDAVKDYARS